MMHNSYNIRIAQNGFILSHYHGKYPARDLDYIYSTWDEVVDFLNLNPLERIEETSEQVRNKDLSTAN